MGGKGVEVSQAPLRETENPIIKLFASLIHYQLQNKFSESLGT